MSVSPSSYDSDDTELLLLISPNYYLNTAEKILEQEEQSLSSTKPQLPPTSDNKTECKSIENLQRILPATTTTNAFQSAANTVMDAEANESFHNLHGLLSNSVATSYRQLAGDTNDYKTEIDNINNISTQLYNREQRPFGNFDNISDLSATSSGIIESTNHKIGNNDTIHFVHSTPKASIIDTKNSNNKTQNNSNRNQNHENYADQDPITLLEIDNFLLDDQTNLSLQRNQSNVMCSSANDRKIDVFENGRLQLHPEKYNYSKANSKTQQMILNRNQPPLEHDNLISLNEIWRENNQLATISPMSVPATTITEEQLRRQHLEKIVQQLLSRQLEYQQRLSVAIEVDKTKDSVLKNLQLQNTSLRDELEQQRHHIHDLERQHRHFTDNLEIMRKELLRMNALNTKYEEKITKLEEELNKCNRKCTDNDHKYQQQIEDLEMQIHACKRSEELAITEMHKNKEKYIKSEHLYEKMKMRCQTLEKENEALQHQKETLQQLHQKQKTRTDSLEVQKKSLQETVEQLTEVEASLKKKMDLQQKTLKSQYQHQLENVVSQKLKEFQEQLDKNEESFKLEARDRERWIVDRAIKQLEQINEKNELELNLLQAKYNEEVQLYRLQLANATQKIEDLDNKLNLYKTKRADIAEKLHHVMETQWRKALEILTAPAQLKDATNQSDTTTTTTTTNNNNSNNSEQSLTSTVLPNTNTIGINISNNENSLKNISKTNHESVFNNKISTVDKLQAYIEALLSKAPSDFDKLDEILAYNAKARHAKEKLEKNTKRQNHNKPPWKA